MSTRTVTIEEACASIAELLALARKGEEVVIMQGAQAVARVVPVETTKTRRTPGLHKGEIQTTVDFDAPLPDDFWGPPK